ncbi:unnamed protein product [Cochlearia groenlandica]
MDFSSIIAMESPNLARLMEARGVKPTQQPVVPPEVAAAQDLGHDLGIDDFESSDLVYPVDPADHAL